MFYFIRGELALLEHNFAFERTTEEGVEHNAENRHHEQHGNPSQRAHRIAVFGDNHPDDAEHSAEIHQQNADIEPFDKRYVEHYGS